MKSSPVRKDLGILVNGKLDISQQCLLAAQKAKYILECFRRNVASRPREVILPLSSTLVTSQQEYHVQYKIFLTTRVMRDWKKTAQRSCGCPIFGSVHRRMV